MQKLSQQYNILLKYLLAAILIAVPLYPKFPFLKIPGTFVSVRLEDILLVFAFILFLIIVFISKEYKNILRDTITKAVVFYLAAGFISLLSGIYITHTVTPYIAILHWIRRVEYFTPFFMAFYLIKIDRKILAYFIKLIVLVVIFSFLYGLGQKYLSWPIIITQNEEYSKGVALRWLPGSHINSTFAGHYDLASYLVMVMPIIITYFFLEKSKKIRVIIGGTYFGGMWLLVNSASRISLVSYLLAVTIALFLVKKYKSIPVVIILSLAFIGFSSNLLSRYGRIFEVALEKVSSAVITDVNAAQDFQVKMVTTPTPTSIPVFEDRSTNIRLNVEWPRSLRAFSKNPLLGTGYSSITLATDNDYLRALGETGILGFLSFISIFWLLALNIYNKFSLISKNNALEMAFTTGIIGSIFGIFINAVFIDVFEASKFAINYWLLMGVSQGLLSKYE